MGYRLSKVYTRTGDDGTTGLGDGSRVAKGGLRIGAIGDVDELNSLLGLLLSSPLPDDIGTLLSEIQHDLFDIGGGLSIPGSAMPEDGAVTRLEIAIDRFNSPLPPLKEFVLPGGSVAAAQCHLARAVCRRVERSVVTLAEHEPVSATTLCYINRLSDLLFVLARSLARHAGGVEVMWNRDRRRG